MKQVSTELVVTEAVELVKVVHKVLLAVAEAVVLPMRADGGPVTGGSPYIVGERGPEVFVPGRSGSIVPNGAGMTIQSLTVNWSSSGGEDEFEQFVAKLERLAAGA